MLLDKDVWISCSERLPEEGVSVLGLDGSSYHIVKVEKGITEEQREKMKSGLMDDPVEMGWCKSQGWFQIKRSESIKSCDVWGNNLVPYCWRTNSGHEIFGQNISFWMPLPLPPYADNTNNSVLEKSNEEAIKEMSRQLLFAIFATTVYEFTRTELEKHE